ncbi:WD40 repeat domain-containing protein [Nocardia sp. NPDC050712]|uniref:WD40 repeat domain-containing protein n=1 Tax=Nocardia sp. NPDC050712 TaxID=3155518 RepID=UPI0033D41575
MTRLFDVHSGVVRWERVLDENLYGHVVWRPDGQFLVLGGHPGLMVVEAANGHTIWFKALPMARNADIFYSADGATIFLPAIDGVLALDADTGALRWRMPHDPGTDRVHCLDLGTDQRFLAVGSGGGESGAANSGGSVRVLHTGDGHERWNRHNVRDLVFAVRFSPDGRFLLYYISGFPGSDRNVLADAATGQPLGTLPGLTEDWPTQFGFSPDSRLLGVAAVTGGTRVLRVYDVATRSLRYEVAGNDPSGVPAFSADSSLVLIGMPSQIRTPTVWALDSETGALRWTMTNFGGMYSAYFDPDGTRVVTSARSGHTVFELAAVTPVRHLLAHDGPVRAVTFSADGTTLVTASGDGTARVFAGGVASAHLSHGAAVTAIACTADGRTVLTGSDDHSARLFTPAGSATAALTVIHDAPVRAVTISGQGQWAATASADATARLINLDDRTHRGLRHPGAVTALAFTPDGTRLVTGCEDGFARLFHTNSAALQLPMAHRGPVLAVAFGSDPMLLATACADHNARLWDIRNGRELQRLEHPSPVQALTFGLEGALLATACADSARVYRTASEQPLRLFRHPRPVRALALDRTGTLLATAAEDAARVFDIETGELRYLLRAGAPVHGVAFDPAATLLAVACADNSARVYEIPPG